LNIYYKDDLCTLIQGECIEVMTKMAGKGLKFDAIITDIPYGTTHCKWDSIIPLDKMWECIKNIRKENAPTVLFGNEPFSSTLRMSNIQEFKYDWYWEKDKGTGAGISKKQPLRKIEILSVFYYKQPYYNYVGNKLEKPYKHTLPVIRSDSYNIASKNITEDNERIYVEYTHSTKHNLLYFSRDNANKGCHPTQKPVKLMEYIIEAYTNEGDTILDFTCGSGTTLVAAKKLNRSCYGVELEEKYCEITKNRLLEI